MLLGTMPTSIQVDRSGQVQYVDSGALFCRRMRELVHTYMPRIHIHWRDQDDNDKKYVLAILAQEFGTGWDEIVVLHEMQILLKHRQNNARERIMVEYHLRTRYGEPHFMATERYRGRCRHPTLLSNMVRATWTRLLGS